jgi:hypothetical protein
MGVGYIPMVDEAVIVHTTGHEFISGIKEFADSLFLRAESQIGGSTTPTGILGLGKVAALLYSDTDIGYGWASFALGSKYVHGYCGGSVTMGHVDVANAWVGNWGFGFEFYEPFGVTQLTTNFYIFDTGNNRYVFSASNAGLTALGAFLDPYDMVDAQFLIVEGALRILNAPTPATMAGAGFFYLQAGALYFKGGAGTVTPLAPA